MGKAANLEGDRGIAVELEKRHIILLPLTPSRR